MPQDDWLERCTALFSMLDSNNASSPPPPPPNGPQQQPQRQLVVGKDARWFLLAPPANVSVSANANANANATANANAKKIDLMRYGARRRLLNHLVIARLEQPGSAISTENLIGAGWPGERMRHTAGLLRVYSAIRRLRRLGLESILITTDDGYLLDPEADVQRVA